MIASSLGDSERGTICDGPHDEPVAAIFRIESGSIRMFLCLHCYEAALMIRSKRESLEIRDKRGEGV